MNIEACPFNIGIFMMRANSNFEIQPYPSSVDVEGIVVTGFANPLSLFERVYEETRRQCQSVVYYLNIHVANTAFINRKLKSILQRADLVYCDGAGIVAGANLLGTPLPTRLTAADWFIDMLNYFAQKQCKVYLLGGEPGVPEAALNTIVEQVPHHSVVGMHHGYILNSPELETQVIDEINLVKPDVLIVGFGTPLQEFWIEKNRARLKVSTIYAIGAVMDFISGRVSRCPRWLGDAGFEWLYRLYTEPGRLLGRYVLGNPWFLARIAFQVICNKLTQPFLGLKKETTPFKQSVLTEK
jgi:N-acetylglucosaminyldiphosphoundecaprenol N-acetyl-beta-D-mannosaminyltransferase